MPRPIGRSPASKPSSPAVSPELKQFKADIKRQFLSALGGGLVTSEKWSTRKPNGRFTSMPLGKHKGPHFEQGYTFTALFNPSMPGVFILKREPKGGKPQFIGPIDTRKQGDQPFFAKFLENQNGGRPGGTIGTEKFPSDNEDSGAGGIGGATTRKFPSDNEDSGTGGIGGATTRKFPSDNEDSGTGGVGGPTTEKYPSDNEDGGAGRP